MEKEEEDFNRLKTYIKAWQILECLYKTGNFRLEILERINQKNADDMGCRAISL